MSATPSTPGARSPRSYWKLIRASLSGEHHDYTSGNLHRAILLLAIPMMLELSMESVFAVVDIYFVKECGEAAVAAVGLTEALMTLLYALAIGLAMGVTATVSRRIGEGDPVAASKATVQAILLGIGISMCVGVVGFLCPETLLEWMGAEPTAVEIGSGYTQVIFTTNAVVILVHLLNAAFRGAGDPFLAMKSLWLANCINIVLDPCLILGLGPFPEMGVTGAAVATSVGRGAGVAYQLWILFRGRGRLRITPDVMVIEPRVMLRLIRVSQGGVLQFLIGTASWVVLMKLVSAFGNNAIAGYTIAVRILMFTFLPAWGLSNAAATLVGQSLGARKPDRAESAVWWTGIYTMAFLAMVTVVFLSLAPDLVGLFTKDGQDPEVLAYGVDCLVIVSYGYVAYAWGMVMMQAFNGAGDTMTPTWINLFCFWMVQLPSAWLLSEHYKLGPTGVFWAIMAAETLLALVSILVFRRGHWKTRTV